MPRVELFQRTDARCETIIENGLIEVHENSSKYTEQQNHCRHKLLASINKLAVGLTSRQLHCHLH